MQHTETYNLNLIETSDTFSPDPLNQNAQALEDALSDETDAREADVADLDARLKVFEAKHIKCGIYTAPRTDNSPMTISLGFTPKAVLVMDGSGNRFGALYNGHPFGADPYAEIVSGGFRLRRTGSSSGGISSTGGTFVYLALD